MRYGWKKQMLAGTMAAAMMAGNVIPALADAAPDGKTDAAVMAEAMGGSQLWDNWKREWEAVKTDWTQISLTPGSDESQLNFAWYSEKNESETSAPKLIIGEGRSMKNSQVQTAVQTAATIAKDGTEYFSNKVTVTGLKANTTYYYSYQQEDGTYTEPEKYAVKSTDEFSFIYVGDPQIGSSNEEKAKKPEDLDDAFYTAQSDSVRSDSFNWEATLNQAMNMSGDQASFVLSAGDQIQTNAKKVADKTVSEVEYAGYLSPDVLKNLPVATTVGNHDSDNENYTYHFNTPNSSELGSNGIVGGDYYFTYGSALFMMLNTQDTNVAEHKQFIEQAVAVNPDCKWRVVTLHQDIYGSAEHSNEPEITNLRYQLVPYFEANDVDVVLTGHDHAYSRSEILKGGVKTTEYTDDEFDEQLDKDLDNGESTETLYTAPGNIKDDTRDEAEKTYLAYLNEIMDKDAVEQTKKEGEAVINPEGILYMTANSASGSKYYDLVPRMQTYIAGRWQEDVPTYSIVNVTDETFSISTYRTDNDEKIDETFTIAKVNIDKTELNRMIAEAAKEKKNSYTADNFKVFEQALAGAKKVAGDTKATRSEVEAAIKTLTNAKATLVKAAVTIEQAQVSSVKKQVYTGKAITPAVTVSVNGTTLVDDTDYTLSYTNNTNTGKAVICITGKGQYVGIKEVTFDIAAKKAVVKSAKSIKPGSAVIQMKKAAGKVSGYEIKYSTSKKLVGAKTKTTSKPKITLKSLKKGKTYYVKARAYKTVSDKKIYGAYSKVCKVVVK